MYAGRSDVLRERARREGPTEQALGANVVAAGPAVFARLAVAERLDANTVARRPACDAFADGRDPAGELVAWSEVRVRREGAVVEVEVAAADAAGADADEYFAGGRLGLVGVAEFDGLLGGDEGGAHAAILRYRR